MKSPALARCEALVKQLIDLGEDKDELNYWIEIFDDMEEADQTTLLDSFTAELRALGAAPVA